MKIETKFNIGDKVTCNHNSASYTGTVNEILVGKSGVRYMVDGFSLTESELQLAPEEVTITLPKETANALYNLLGSMSIAKWNELVLELNVGDEYKAVCPSTDRDYPYNIYKALKQALDD